MYVLIFYVIFFWNISYSKNNYERYKKFAQFANLHIYAKRTLFLSDLNQTVIFSADFQKVLRYQKIKIIPVFHVDRRMGGQQRRS